MQAKTIFYIVIGVALAVAAAGQARADELPLHKAGLWEIKVSMQRPGAGRSPPSTSRRCMDPASEEEEEKDMMRGMREGDVTCTKKESKKTATGYVLDSACTSKSAGMTATSHVEITGDFNSAYTMKSTMQTKGEKDPRRMTAEYKYAGACPAGWKPGEVEMNGRRFHPKNRIKGNL